MATACNNYKSDNAFYGLKIYTIHGRKAHPSQQSETHCANRTLSYILFWLT